jgi:putative hydrolase of HD superfamily
MVPVKKLINFFYEIGTLRKLKRSYLLHMLQDVESVAEHSHRAMVIGYLMARKLKANFNKVMIMAAFHDIPETRTGDANWHQKQYVSQDEEKAVQAQLNQLGTLGNELKDLIKEYKERKTPESKIAKDAEIIEYVLSLKELELQGNLEAKRRLQSKKDTTPKNLYTSLAKKMLAEIKKSSPNEWFQADRTKTRKEYIVQSTHRKVTKKRSQET